MYNIKWQEDRVKAILAETEEEAQREAKIKASGWEAQLIMHAIHTPLGLEVEVKAALRAGHWEALRAEAEASLRAATEQALRAAGLNGEALTIEELARRIARVQILAAEGSDVEVVVTAIAEGMGGMGARLETWRCTRGHQVRALSEAPFLTCPVCGAPGASVKAN